MASALRGAAGSLLKALSSAPRWQLVSSRSLSAVESPPARADAVFKVTMVPGDGVGPELMTAVKEVFKAGDIPVEFEEFHLSEVQNMASEEKLDQVLTSMRNNRVAIKGKIHTPMEFKGELASYEMRLRRKLDLFANVVHVNSLPGYSTRHNNLDLVIIREQTEGEYSSLEHESVSGVIECLKIITREKSRRIAKFAFDYATKKGRSKVTAVHKANIMKLGDGLFLQSCAEVAQLYPKIKYENIIIDNCCMQLVQNPYQFDVLVMPNLYGNIIDNLAAGAGGRSRGGAWRELQRRVRRGARHPFAQAVGRNIANPTAMLLSAANMLRHLNLEFHSQMISDAVKKVIKQGKVRTRDLGGYSTTGDFVRAVVENLRHRRPTEDSLTPPHPPSPLFVRQIWEDIPPATTSPEPSSLTLTLRDTNTNLRCCSDTQRPTNLPRAPHEPRTHAARAPGHGRVTDRPGAASLRLRTAPAAALQPRAPPALFPGVGAEHGSRARAVARSVTRSSPAPSRAVPLRAEGVCGAARGARMTEMGQSALLLVLLLLHLSPTRAQDPAPDLVPDPVPDPTSDPAPDPVPVPDLASDPTPDPVPDPASDPALDPGPSVSAADALDPPTAAPPDAPPPDAPATPSSRLLPPVDPEQPGETPTHAPTPTPSPPPTPTPTPSNSTDDPGDEDYIPEPDPTPGATPTPDSTSETSPQDEDSEEDVPIIAVMVALSSLLVIIFIIIILYMLRFKKYKQAGSHSTSFRLTNGRSEDTELQSVPLLARSPSTNRKYPPLPVDKLEEEMNRRMADDNKLFREEFNALPVCPIQASCDAASKEENKEKNRYVNILPYDHSRVHLSLLEGVPDSDFINASFINGYQEKNKFIAAQGPKEETVNDYWRMIWEQNTATIVMVTNLKERKECKCAQYWPDQGCWTYGSIRVSVEDTTVLVDYTVRKFCIQQIGDVSGKKPQRLLTQFHFTSWPDFGVPFTPIGMLKFLKKVKNCNPPYAGPIVVHCSAGVGRTGTFIVIDAMLDMMMSERKVDVFGFVTRIRAQRCQMVQTDMQYVFIFQALLEHYLYGDTELEVTSLESHLSKLYAPAPGAGCSGLEAEFKGYRQKDSYMASQGPLQHTIEDFWRMIWEWRSCSIVMLTELEERGQEKCAQYWPSDGAVVHGDISIELKREEESESYTVRDLLVTNTRENKARAVRQFHFPRMARDRNSHRRKRNDQHHRRVQKQQQQSGNHPITVHCR
ncbi:hypothetical protein WMY93_011221 [Mugilogobius chulae]|uniref:protein-tyrosine-phosphatase n=1 Tax=Mugilogobius chulae TaxID=88201 RepID=A0AAW0P247_9GOBI